MSNCSTCNHHLFKKEIKNLTTGMTTKGVDFCPYCRFPYGLEGGPVSWENNELIQKDKTTDDTLQNPGDIFGFISSGYSDYIAARQLLLNNQNLNGAIFSCQAIEKLMKAQIIYKQNSGLFNMKEIEPFMESHRPYELYHLYIRNITSFKKYQGPFLNKNFLKLLEKVYPLRYKSNFFNWGASDFRIENKGFNVILNNKQILMELDMCMYNLMIRLQFHFTEQRDFQNPYIRDFRNTEKFFIEENIAYQLHIHKQQESISTVHNVQQIFLKKCHIQEILVDSKDQLRELFYFTKDIPRNTTFDLQSNVKPATDPSKVDSIDPKFPPIEKFDEFHNVFFKIR